MQKPANTQFDVMEPVHQRWSPRAFADKPVEAANLHSVLEAARWAASAFNEQPWRYVVATKEDEALYANLLDTLVDKNQMWAKSAPVLMLAIAKDDYTQTGKPNAHSWHDVGMANAQLSLQATKLGLSTHFMAGFVADKAKENLNIPEGFTPVAAIALGYDDDPETLPEDFQDAERAPRSRKDHGDIFFNGHFGTALIK